MSLKAFHIVFVIASILMCFGIAAWARGQYKATEETSYVWGAAISAISGVALSVYCVRVIRKLKNVSYL